MILFDKFKDGYGNKLSRKPTKTSTLLLLFIFLHRFYVKRPISGLLFMFTFGGFGIWWIIDLITILCGKFKNAEGQYIK
ncbi:TM2 domain-containing protein [bacterium]|nr:TM2 domain-containing protein [bacterium]